MQQTAAQPTGPSGSPPPVWRLIRLDTPPPPRTPRLGPSSLQSAIKRSADTTAANEIEREQRTPASSSAHFKSESHHFICFLCESEGDNPYNDPIVKLCFGAHAVSCYCCSARHY
ncbi:hypothetical protein TKK_0018065 [Trichogramma kaykai]